MRNNPSMATPRKIEGGTNDLFAKRHSPCEISWKSTIWNINIQCKNEWCTLQKCTKPVFSKRHSGNSVNSSFYLSWFWQYYQAIKSNFCIIHRQGRPGTVTRDDRKSEIRLIGASCGHVSVTTSLILILKCLIVSGMKKGVNIGAEFSFSLIWFFSFIVVY